MDDRYEYGNLNIKSLIYCSFESAYYAEMADQNRNISLLGEMGYSKKSNVYTNHIFGKAIIIE